MCFFRSVTYFREADLKFTAGLLKKNNLYFYVKCFIYFARQFNSDCNIVSLFLIVFLFSDCPPLVFYLQTFLKFHKVKIIRHNCFNIVSSDSVKNEKRRLLFRVRRETQRRQKKKPNPAVCKILERNERLKSKNP